MWFLIDFYVISICIMRAFMWKWMGKEMDITSPREIRKWWFFTQRDVWSSIGKYDLEMGNSWPKHENKFDGDFARNNQHQSAVVISCLYIQWSCFSIRLWKRIGTATMVSESSRTLNSPTVSWQFSQVFFVAGFRRDRDFTGFNLRSECQTGHGAITMPRFLQGSGSGLHRCFSWWFSWSPLW